MIKYLILVFTALYFFVLWFEKQQKNCRFGHPEGFFSLKDAKIGYMYEYTFEEDICPRCKKKVFRLITNIDGSPKLD